MHRIQPYLLTQSQPNGPVIALQIENEYPHDDDYLEWSVDMTRSVTTRVPWILCHNVQECGQFNNRKFDPTDDKVLCSINGFWMDAEGGGDHGCGRRR
jgi:hypothetical protein